MYTSFSMTIHILNPTFSDHTIITAYQKPVQTSLTTQTICSASNQ